MKKLVILMVIVSVFCFLTDCGKKDEPMHLGVNAEILEINKQVKGIVVKSLDTDSVLGDKCYVNCENQDTKFIEVINGEVLHIKFSDLSVGDRITVDVGKVEDKYTATKHLQLEERVEEK